MNVHIYLKERCGEDMSRLFSMVPGDMIRGNGHKLKDKRFHLNISKHFFTLRMSECLHRLPRETVKTPSVKTFKTHMDTVLGN